MCWEITPAVRIKNFVQIHLVSAHMTMGNKFSDFCADTTAEQ